MNTVFSVGGKFHQAKITMTRGIRMGKNGCVRTVTERMLPLVLAGNWASEFDKVRLLKRWTGKRTLMGLSLLLVGAGLLGCAQELAGRPDNSSNRKVSSQALVTGDVARRLPRQDSVRGSFE